MRTRQNNDRMLLESLVKKYGKNGVRKAINEMKKSDLEPIREIIDKCVEYCFGDIDETEARYIKRGVYFGGSEYLDDISEYVYEALDEADDKLTDEEYDYICDHPELVRGSIRRFFKNFKTK